MFDMMKPMLVAMLKSCADQFEELAGKHVARANTIPATSATNIEARTVLFTRAGIWEDAAQMIRKSFP